MSEMPEPDGDLSEEFRRLGQNLRDVLRTTWDGPDRQRLEHELKAGLRQAADALAELAEEAVESETGRRLRSELQSLGDRVRGGELERKLRTDLLAALQSLNADLERARDRSAGAEPPSGAEV